MFRDEEGLGRRYYAVERTRMQRHEGVAEILLVLRGTLSVTVSCEQFTLTTGDYAVLNAGDPHMLVGEEENVTAVMHAQLSDFAGSVPGIDGVIFACESFDLPRSRGNEHELRRKIIALLQSSNAESHERMAELLTELGEGYSYEDYYERSRQISGMRRVQFREIVSAMRSNLAERDVLERVAEEQNYHKSSLSRIVRDASAVSFSDLLTYLRVAAAEVALLESEATVAQIAADCGFSDAKYFTRAFRAWFGERPADYRRRVRLLATGEERIADVAGEGKSLLAELRRAPAKEAALPRLSVTPLLVKNLGGRSDLFRAVMVGTHAPEMTAPMTTPPRIPHLLPIRVPHDGTSALGWTDILRGIDRAQFSPVLVLPLGEVALLARVVAHASSLDVDPPGYWIAYGVGELDAAEHLANELFTRCGVSVIPVAAG